MQSLSAMRNIPLRRSPSWGAWIEMLLATQIARLPKASLPLVGSVDRNAPSKGAPLRKPSSLPLVGSVDRNGLKRRDYAPNSPSLPLVGSVDRNFGCRPHIYGAPRRSPSWGAWIEIFEEPAVRAATASLPLVGSVDRNSCQWLAVCIHHRRSPSWGAWIEMRLLTLSACCCIVAPPRGERGSKLLAVATVAVHMQSLPLVGSVDRNVLPISLYAVRICRSPSWGAWIEIAGCG